MTKSRLCQDFFIILCGNDFTTQDVQTKEQKAKEIISNSNEIICLLERDNIKIDEIFNCHIYPVVDIATPQLCSNRLEYNFSNGFIHHKIFNINKIQEIYSDIHVLKNEQGISELGFYTKNVCEEYTHMVAKIWPKLSNIANSASPEGYVVPLVKNNNEIVRINTVSTKVQQDIDNYFRPYIAND